MIHIIKNAKWVIATAIACILLGALTFLTFVNRSFIKLNDINLQILLFADLVLLVIFFILIIRETYKIYISKKRGELGSETSLRYLIFFSTTTLLPAVIVAVFSLILFNVTIQQYFNQKIKSIVHSSREVALNYVEETKNSIEADILLMLIDVDKKSTLFYENPKRFLNLLSGQRLLRRLDEVHILDGAGTVLMSNIVDSSMNYVPPPEEALIRATEGKPVRITDPETNRTSALVKLNNFIDTYLYIIKFMDPKLIDYLKQTNYAIGFYYTVRDQRTGIQISFAIIYVLIVSLLLFLSVVIALNFSSRLTRPIINLIGASEKISSGDLAAKVPNISTDKEFKKLNENFNLMIDKLKKQQEKLILSERHSAWENVARKLAHEIKNPLTPIQLSIDRIREKYLSKVGDENKNLSSYLDTMTKQIKDIEHLVTEFSDFARMPKPIFKKINLSNIISRSLNLHSPSEPKIKFITNNKNEKNLFNGDEEQINRVFINLIKNSIESIHEKSKKNLDFKGKINIDINQDSDYIYATVIDNGVGFDNVDKAKMLTPYFTTKKTGTGLGLAVVTKIIADHNGIIEFNSTKNGAEVRITLPKQI